VENNRTKAISRRILQNRENSQISERHVTSDHSVEASPDRILQQNHTRKQYLCVMFFPTLCISYHSHGHDRWQGPTINYVLTTKGYTGDWLTDCPTEKADEHDCENYMERHKIMYQTSPKRLWWSLLLWSWWSGKYLGRSLGHPWHTRKKTIFGVKISGFFHDSGNRNDRPSLKS